MYLIHPDYVERNRSKLRHSIRRLRLFVWRRPQTIFLIALILLSLLYLVYQVLMVSPLSTHDPYDHQMAGIGSVDKCSPMGTQARSAFETFIKRIINTLDLLNVTHFMCYDSLWTALRRSNAAKSKAGKANKSNILRMADGCFNLCVLNEDLIKHDEALIERRFRNNGIRLRYIHSDGLYILKPNTQIYSSGSNRDDDPALHLDIFSIHARVHVFEKDSLQDMYRRVGWKSRMLPSTMCTRLHCFPPSLIEDRPLPQLEFASSLSVNVPREGIEIQKYHYPDTWWTMANSEQDECSTTN